MLGRMDTNTVLVGDCVRVLAGLPPGVADLAYPDPPFNLGLAYPGCEDRRTPDAHLAWTREWLAAVRRVLSPSGSLFVQIDPRWAGYVQVGLDALGLCWRNTLVWHYRFGPHQRPKFGRNHQQVLYYTAHPRRFTFNADAVR
jgi:site-specific DNA-methyltransferase (adenine-specific)